MSKKLSKFLLFSAAAGVAAYGAYYYLQKKGQTSAPLKEEDTDDDFDDFSEDLDEDLPPTKERSYVSLNLDKAEAFATEAFQKAKEVIADSVQQVKDTVKSVTEAQANKDVVVDVPTEDVTIEDAVEKVTETVEGTAQAAKKATEETVSNVVEGIDNAIDNLAEEIYSTGEEAVAEEVPVHVPDSETIEEFFDDDDEPAGKNM